MRAEPTALNWISLGESVRDGGGTGGIVQMFIAAEAMQVGDDTWLAPDQITVGLGSIPNSRRIGRVVGGKRTGFVCLDDAQEVGSLAASVDEPVIVAVFGFVYNDSGEREFVQPGTESVTLPDGGRTVDSLSTYLANNKVYNPLDWRDGVITDDAVLISAAIAAARTVGGTVEIPEGNYDLRSPINVTTSSTDSGDVTRPIVIRSRGAVSPGNATYGSTLRAAHNGHVFDCAGTPYVIWEYINITTEAGSTPKCAWFLARNSAGSNCGSHTFNGCRAYGSFANGVVYSYAAEVNSYNDCRFFNLQTNGRVFTFTAANIDSLSSTFITIATGVQSNIVTKVNGGEYGAFASGGKVFYLDRHDGLSVKQCWMLAGDATANNGHSLFYIDQSVGTSNFLSISEVTGENAPSGMQEYGVYFTNDSRTPAHVTVQRCVLPNITRAMWAGALVTLSNVTIKDISEVGGSNGCEFAGTFDTCTFDSTTHLIVNRWVNSKGFLPQSYLTITGEQTGGQCFFQEGNVVINSQTTRTGTFVGAGGAGVIAMARGAQPAAIGSLGQLFVDGSGNLKYVGPSGTVTTLGAS